MHFVEIVEHLVFGALLNALLLAAVLGWMSRFIPNTSTSAAPSTLGSAELLIAFSIVLSASIVAIVTVGGTLGWASSRAAMLGLTATLAIAPAIGTGNAVRRHFERLVRTTRILVNAGSNLVTRALEQRSAALALCSIAVPWTLLLADRIFAPPVTWDALTYHLLFPLHWMQGGRLDTLVQPTGEPSSPFYPLVGEMHYYWGFLSTGTDAWSALSQVPFLVVSSIAVAGIARLTGAAPIGAILAAALWATLPVVLRQSVEPMVDLASAAFFISAVFLLIRWRTTGESWRFVIACAALGLSLGVKYIGIVWIVGAIPLYLATISRNARPVRAPVFLLSLALCLVLGGYAYARNIWVGGNPVLPLEVTFAGRTLLQGTRTLGQYFGSQLHQSVLATLVASRRAILDLGPLAPVSIALAVVALIGGIGDTGRRMRVAVAATALLSLAFFLIAVPYREPRHLLAPLALAIAVVPAVLQERVRSVSFGSRVMLIPLLNAPFSLFHWTRDLLQTGVGPRHAIALLACVFVILAIAPLRKIPRPFTRLKFAGFFGVTALVLVFALAGYESQRFVQWQRYWSSRIPWGSSEPRPELVEAARAWSLIAERTRFQPATLAYVGTNIPYPLAGAGLRNRVRIVPRNENREAWHYDWSTPVPDPFDRSSAEAWRENVSREGIRYLCIFREVGANDPLERFPVEAQWAASDSGAFRPIFTGAWVRVYEVTGPRSVLGSERETAPQPGYEPAEPHPLKDTPGRAARDQK